MNCEGRKQQRGGAKSLEGKSPKPWPPPPLQNREIKIGGVKRNHEPENAKSQTREIQSGQRFGFRREHVRDLRKSLKTSKKLALKRPNPVVNGAKIKTGFFDMAARLRDADAAPCQVGKVACSTGRDARRLGPDMPGEPRKVTVSCCDPDRRLKLKPRKGQTRRGDVS